MRRRGTSLPGGFALSLVAAAGAVFAAGMFEAASAKPRDKRGTILYPERPRHASRPELAFTPQIPHGVRSGRQPTYSSLSAHELNVCRIWLKVTRCDHRTNTTSEARFVRALLTEPTLGNRRNLERDLGAAGIPVVIGVPAIEVIRPKDHGAYLGGVGHGRLP